MPKQLTLSLSRSQLIYSVALVSGVQPDDSVIHMCVFIHAHTHIYIYTFHTLFHYDLLKNVENSSLCYIVGHGCLCILYIIVCIC